MIEFAETLGGVPCELGVLFIKGYALKSRLSILSTRPQLMMQWLPNT
jgi:hypothetical protein